MPTFLKNLRPCRDHSAEDSLALWIAVATAIACSLSVVLA